MSSDSTISTRDLPHVYPLPHAQEFSNILNNPVGHEIVHATCRENAYLRQKALDLEEEIQLWKQSLSENAHHLRRAHQKATDMEASANNMHIQLRQQTAIEINIK